MSVPTAIDRVTFNAHRLMRDHPPVIENRNKQVLFDIACPAVSVHEGEITYTRWRAATLPTHLEALAAPDIVEIRANVYDYAPVEGLEGAVEWHVNFADPLLFVAYGSGLFAQDEIMAAEHPALGALVEALHSMAHRAVTEDASGPTPVLITGVERRIAVATDANRWEGRSKGLYGNAFAAASPRQVREATRRIDPPTVTNIIAIAAPRGGPGAYTRQQIERIVTTAYTGFAAAVAASSVIDGERPPVVVHTGYWGCGAFGGNRVLMSLLQLMAARLAGATRLVYHTVDLEGAAPLDEALSIWRTTFTERPPVGVNEALRRITALGLEWGTSDGN